MSTCICSIFYIHWLHFTEAKHFVALNRTSWSLQTCQVFVRPACNPSCPPAIHGSSAFHLFLVCLVCSALFPVSPPALHQFNLSFSSVLLHHQFCLVVHCCTIIFNKWQSIDLCHLLHSGSNLNILTSQYYRIPLLVPVVPRNPFSWVKLVSTTHDSTLTSPCVVHFRLLDEGDVFVQIVGWRRCVCVCASRAH